MKLNTDNTARLVVLMLCVSIVIMRLLKPSIPFDACSLGALAVAGLIAIAPVWRGGTAKTHGEGPSADDVDALRAAAIDAQAMLSVDVCAEYFRGCFMRRNEWMVAHSARLIAVFNGTHGGTHATILRALRGDLDIHAIMI